LFKGEAFYEIDGNCENDSSGGYFAKCYSLNYIGGDSRTMMEDMILMTYYSFTSLSTVGFGDFHPKSNTERLVISQFLMFGVAVFSYIMGNFIEILNKFKNFTAENDEGENLSKFFGVIKKFNKNEEIKLKMKEEIE
jgi:hypothetical protein